MSPLPAPWLWVSGLCFAFSLLANLVLILVMIMLYAKIGPLIKEVREKVQTIGGKATDIATTAQTTVQTVHNKTTQIMGATESASAEVTRKISAAGAAITAIFVATRIVGVVRGMSGDGHRKRIRA